MDQLDAIEVRVGRGAAEIEGGAPDGGAEGCPPASGVANADSTARLREATHADCLI